MSWDDLKTLTSVFALGTGVAGLYFNWQTRRDLANDRKLKVSVAIDEDPMRSSHFKHDDFHMVRFRFRNPLVGDMVVTQISLAGKSVRLFSLSAVQVDYSGEKTFSVLHMGKAIKTNIAVEGTNETTATTNFLEMFVRRHSGVSKTSVEFVLDYHSVEGRRKPLKAVVRSNEFPSRERNSTAVMQPSATN